MTTTKPNTANIKHMSVSTDAYRDLVRLAARLTMRSGRRVPLSETLRHACQLTNQFLDSADAEHAAAASQAGANGHGDQDA